MALYTKRQFSDLVQIPSKDLSNYIKRGHVTLQGGKVCSCVKGKCDCLIDDQDEINQVFIEKRGVTVQEKAETPIIQPEKPEEKQDSSTKKAVKSTVNPIKSTEFSQIKKERELKMNEQIEKQNRILDVKLAKLSEEIVPRDIVVHMVVAQSEALKGAYLRAVDTFITQFAAQNQLPREEIVYWKKELTKVVNVAVEDSVKQSKVNLRKMAKEYAGNKGKGERNDT